MRSVSNFSLLCVPVLDPASKVNADPDPQPWLHNLQITYSLSGGLSSNKAADCLSGSLCSLYFLEGNERETVHQVRKYMKRDLLFSFTFRVWNVLSFLSLLKGIRHNKLTNMVINHITQCDGSGSAFISFGWSGSVLWMRIQIHEHGNWPKFTKKPGFLPF